MACLVRLFIQFGCAACVNANRHRARYRIVFIYIPISVMSLCATTRQADTFYRFTASAARAGDSVRIAIF